MTTPEETPLTDIYSHEQIVRLAALQGVVALANANPGVLIELADYVIGDVEPFDPVALAHTARVALDIEQGNNYNGYSPVSITREDIGYDEDECAGEYGLGANVGPPLIYGLPPVEPESEEPVDVGCHNDASCAWCGPEPEHMARADIAPEEDSFTVGDLEGFLTLPETAVLEDEDGDIWRHNGEDWYFAGAYGSRAPHEIFTAFGNDHGELHFVVTNPEVLA